MNASIALPLPGCRHDVLGHALKAIGVLRAISECASPEDCDPSAEGWWNPDTASFMVRSDRYPDVERLAQFFAEKYRPTPVIAAWNKGGGVTDKIEVTISCRAGDVSKFRERHESVLEDLGLKKNKHLSKTGALVFTLKDQSRLDALKKMTSEAGLGCAYKVKQQGGNAKTEVTIASNSIPLETFVEQQRPRLTELGLSAGKGISAGGQLKFSTDSANKVEVERLVAEFNAAASVCSDETALADDVERAQPDGPLHVAIIAKESGKKDGVLPSAAKLLSSDQAFQACLELARRCVAELQGAGDADEEVGIVFLRYRDQLPDAVAESFDSLCALHISQQNDNPLFVRRGRPGDKVNADIFLNFWDYFVSFRKNAPAFVQASLFCGRVVGSGISAGDQRGKGTPFFPDAIKSYNQGIDWVTEDFPFCPLDYLLAVEGALAMRGATSKTLSARARSRAAFPFVFEGTETMTDEQGKSLRLASSFWLPIWTRPTTFRELQSFVLDCQARLPSKDCRFSSDFARAIRSQGVDAGFFAFQEFQFKLKGANVPWTTAGRFVACSGTATANVLNELLAPVDASGFLNQFEFHSSREQKKDLHPWRAPILDAIEIAVAEPDAPKILDVLCRLATLNAHLARSKAVRKDVGTARVAFVPPLWCDDWSIVLRDLEADPEFEIARALASIQGNEKQPDGSYSEVQPFLGSLLPLRRSQRDWFLPDPPSPQAVWTGIDLARDLASILARRVLDASADVRPAVIGTCTARLATILRFLRGELDDRRIASLVEALSLIDWRSQSVRQDAVAEETFEDECLDPLPVAYASVRALLEIASEVKPHDGAETTGRSGPRADVQRTVSLVCRQEPRMVVAGTTEALRRLAIVGVPNKYGEDIRLLKPTLAGRDVVDLELARSWFCCENQLSRRLAAAVLIPLVRRDRWKLFRAITLPQTTSR
jgi:CRISPR-associated protein Csx17